MGSTNNKKKTIKNIKGLDKAHPYSRKATQMKRAIQREGTLGHKVQIRSEPKKRTVDKILWFKNAIEGKDIVSLAELRDIINNYINRHLDEITSIKSKLRPGRPKPSRLDLLENLKKIELQEFKIGMEVPNLTNKEVVEYLKFWDGDHNAIAPIINIRVKPQEDDNDLNNNNDESMV